MSKPLRAFIDVETTGTDEEKHYIHQLACIITEPDGTYIDTLGMRFRPSDLDHCEASALDVVKTTAEELMSRKMSQARAFNRFTDFLGKHVDRFDKKDKLQFVAYKSDFDEKFIRKFFERNNDDFYGSYFYNPSICMMRVAAFFGIDDRNSFPNYKLETLCRSAGIEWDEDQAHDATYDIKQTVEFYKYFYRLMQ